MYTFDFDIIVAYDGGSYQGWQSNREGFSIEETFRKAFSLFLPKNWYIDAASRTDRGVHAKGQRIGLKTNLKIPPAQLLWQINRLLPKDIRVVDVQIPDPSWHPSLSVLKKIYSYTLDIGKIHNPLYLSSAWSVGLAQDFSLTLAEEFADRFVGVHDFSFLCNKRKQQKYSSYEREIFAIDFQRTEKNIIKIFFTGTSFLYRMVRNLTGMIVWVGRKKLPWDTALSIIENKDRGVLYPTAPPQGLCLENIIYKNDP